jgi:hypothetical protein
MNVSLGLVILARSDAEFDDNFVGDHAGVFPLAFADVKSEPLDRQLAFEHLLAAFVLTVSGKLTSAVLPLIVSLPVTFSLPAPFGLIAVETKVAFGNWAAVEPFLLAATSRCIRLRPGRGWRCRCRPRALAARDGGVVVDLGRELLEFRFDRHVHLLEHGGHAAFGGSVLSGAAPANSAGTPAARPEAAQLISWTPLLSKMAACAA